MKRRLTPQEIKNLASYPKVNQEAVYNFLGTLPENTSQQDDDCNLAMDTKLYGWNEETIRAISFGISEAFHV